MILHPSRSPSSSSVYAFLVFGLMIFKLRYVLNWSTNDWPSCPNLEAAAFRLPRMVSAGSVFGLLSPPPPPPNKSSTDSPTPLAQPQAAPPMVVGMPTSGPARNPVAPHPAPDRVFPKMSFAHCGPGAQALTAFGPR